MQAIHVTLVNGEGYLGFISEPGEAGASVESVYGSDFLCLERAVQSTMVWGKSGGLQTAVSKQPLSHKNTYKGSVDVLRAHIVSIKTLDDRGAIYQQYLEITTGLSAARILFEQLTNEDANVFWRRKAQEYAAR